MCSSIERKRRVCRRAISFLDFSISFSISVIQSMIRFHFSSRYQSLGSTAPFSLWLRETLTIAPGFIDLLFGF